MTRPNTLSVGIIVWLSSELMFFAGLFAMYFTHRSVAGPAAWGEYAEVLNVPFAAINTIILASSSITCQFGVWKAEKMIPRRTGSLFNVKKWGMHEWYLLSFFMGAIFICLQAVEYSELIHEGVTIPTSSYGSVFYITTGFHAIHVIGGLVAFLLIIGRTAVAKRFSHREASSAVVTSYYWHFVDVIWIALFFIIYVLR
ncbi:MAG: heme-copper oxidase subunit III [Flaviflexus sp.]|nr:heme-copper oxidase subunit III [Flaviflexus sp.]